VDAPAKSIAVKGIHVSDAILLVAGAGAVFAAISRGPEPLGMLSIWTGHAMIGSLLSARIVLFGRRRVHWESLDLLAFLLPFATWVALMNYSSVGKSLGNLAEPMLLSLTFPIAALLRVGVGTRINQRLCSIGLVTLLCITSAAVHRLTPSLPE
jgi:hypothetical protein